MLRRVAQLISISAIAILFFAFCFATSAYAATDVVTFGKYPQSILEGKTDGLVEGSDYVRYGGTNYRVEPITWRLVPLENNTAYLISEKTLFALDYSQLSDVTWANSEINRYLNGVSKGSYSSFKDGLAYEFLWEGFFTADERNTMLGSKSGRFSILNDKDIQNANYGFDSDESRISGLTAFSKALSQGSANGYWINSSTALPEGQVRFISSSGVYAPENVGSASEVRGVRPIIKIDLSKTNFNEGIASAAPLDSGARLLNLKATAGLSIHGGYISTTNKCLVCHSAHSAPDSGAGTNVHLLRSGANDACAYCHIDTSSARSTKQVYGGNVANYNTPNDNGHNSVVVDGLQSGVTCADCHTVHGATASTGNEYLDAALLRAPSSDLSGFIAYQDDPPKPEDSEEIATSKWCVSCHPQAANGMGHVSTTKVARTEADGGFDHSLASYSGGQVAWSDSTTCNTCHGAGYDDNSSAWPHYVADAKKFLLSAPSSSEESTGAASSQQDGVCLRCHKGSSTSGIGIDF